MGGVLIQYNRLFIIRGNLNTESGTHREKMMLRHSYTSTGRRQPSTSQRERSGLEPFLTALQLF